MVSNSSISEPATSAAAPRRRPLPLVVRKAAILAVAAVAFGWLFSLAAPWAFQHSRAAGFGYGLLHGAMMPLALPSLVTGHDVAIYDPHNAGRTYNIGYICGVNICGLVFIGPLFWRPRPLTTTKSCISE